MATEDAKYYFEKLSRKDALRLYIRFYCSQKVGRQSKHNKIMEAKKSWLSLTESEKMQFFNKYKECQIKRKEKIVEYLDKAEPFMKKIKKSVSEEDLVNINATIDLQQDKEPGDTEMKQTADTECEENNSVVENLFDNSCLDKTKTEQEDDIPDHLHTSPCNSEAGDLIGMTLVEPQPPMLKSGKELYELIKPKRDNSNDDTWTCLSSIEKCRYNRAVLTLKKNYIVNYKLFLESLSPRELFEHYHKTID